MATNKITTSNVTFYPQPNGDLLIRRRHFRNLVGVVLALPFIAAAVFVVYRFFVSLLFGQLRSEDLGEALVWLASCSGVGLAGGALLLYSARELRSPDLLIEKSLRRVTLRPRLVLGAPTQIQSLEAFTHVAHRIVSRVDERGADYAVHRVDLIRADGSVMPIAEVAKKQHGPVMDMLAAATGLPQLRPPAI